MIAGVRAVLFDLFGTVVLFPPRVPTVQVGGSQWRTTMGWLREAADEVLPAGDFPRLLEALWATTEEIVRQRAPEFIEVPSAERFRRALVRIGYDGEIAHQRAARLSLVHMNHLASTVVLPPDHWALLESLSRRFPLGLVSNFDHGPTARSLIDRHGVAPFFRSIVVSDGFGRRKPHPSIFQACLADLGVSPEEALFIGDSLDDDVIGAKGAGMRVVWIDEKGGGAPSAVTPDFVISRLPELGALLA